MKSLKSFFLLPFETLQKLKEVSESLQNGYASEENNSIVFFHQGETRVSKLSEHCSLPWDSICDFVELKIDWFYNRSFLLAGLIEPNRIQQKFSLRTTDQGFAILRLLPHI